MTYILFGKYGIRDECTLISPELKTQWFYAAFYKNIYEDGKYYTIRLTILGKRTYFGSFKTEDDALIHYNTIAESYGYKQQQRL